MNEIKHHLTDEMLVAYAAGSLPEAFSLVVAAHVSLCDECRARLEGFEAVGGSVLDETEEVAVSSGSLEATLKLIEGGPKDPIRTRAVKGSVFPAPLQDYVGADPAKVRWRPMGRGVKQAVIRTSRDASVRLLHIPSGCAMPDHGHGGTELTLVLQGAFRDGADRFGPGDVEVADQHVDHSPVAEDGADCICLAATDAPLKFNALIPRIAQPFLRI